MKPALLIKTTGEKVELDISRNELEILQKGVGGYVQAVALSERLTLWCNEDGKMLNLPLNPIAQRLWEEVYGPTDILVGDVILTGGTGPNGDTLALPFSEYSRLVKL